MTESVNEIPASPSPYPILYGLLAVLITGYQAVSVTTVVAGATVSSGVVSSTTTSSSVLPPQDANKRTKHNNRLIYLLLLIITPPSNGYSTRINLNKTRTKKLLTQLVAWI